MEAQQHVQQLGMPVPVRPQDDRGDWAEPRLPRDVTAISNRDLGQLYGQFSAFAIWATWVVANDDVSHMEKKHIATVEKAQAHVLAEGPADMRRATAQVEVEGREREALVKRAKEKLTSALLKGYDDAVKTLSREMARREMLVELNRKER